MGVDSGRIAARVRSLRTGQGRASRSLRPVFRSLMPFHPRRLLLAVALAAAVFAFAAPAGFAGHDPHAGPAGEAHPRRARGESRPPSGRRALSLGRQLARRRLRLLRARLLGLRATRRRAAAQLVRALRPGSAGCALAHEAGRLALLLRARARRDLPRPWARWCTRRTPAAWSRSSASVARATAADSSARVASPPADRAAAISTLEAWSRSASRAGFPPPSAFRSRSSPTARGPRSSATAGRCSRTEPGGGYAPLRAWLGERHGVDPSRVLVTNGSLQGFVFLANRFAGERRFLVEAPTYDRPLKILRELGADVVAIPQDEDGLDVDALEDELRRGPALLYTIPTFQNPSGRTLTTERRRRVAELAAERDLLVYEDDPYGLVRFEGEAPPSLLELAGGEDVLYSSSFSKTIAPGVRVGYFVLPEALAAELEALAVSTYITPALLGEATVYEFLRRGAFEPNLERVCGLLRERRDAMLGALESELGDRASWSRPEGGYFLWLDLGVETVGAPRPAPSRRGSRSSRARTSSRPARAASAPRGSLSASSRPPRSSRGSRASPRSSRRRCGLKGPRPPRGSRPRSAARARAGGAARATHAGTPGRWGRCRRRQGRTGPPAGSSNHRTLRLMLLLISPLVRPKLSLQTGVESTAPARVAASPGGMKPVHFAAHSKMAKSAQSWRAGGNVARLRNAC